MLCVFAHKTNNRLHEFFVTLSEMALSYPSNTVMDGSALLSLFIRERKPYRGQ